jgi:hypothetical protein
VGIDVTLEGCERVRNGSASDREITVAGGRTGGTDKVVKPIDYLTSPGNGDKVCRDPLANVASSRRGDTTIASGSDQKAGAACKIGRAIAWIEAVIAIRAVAEAKATLRSMIISPGSRGVKFPV